MFLSRGQSFIRRRSIRSCTGQRGPAGGRDDFHTARAGAIRRPLLPGRHREQDQLGCGQGRGRAAHVPGRAGSSRDDRLARGRRVRAPAAAAGVEQASSFAHRHRAVGRRLSGPCATTTPEPGCGWLWLNGESISPTNTATPYTNWLTGEPNNLKHTPDTLSARHRRSSRDRPRRRLRLERRRRAHQRVGLHRRVRRRAHRARLDLHGRSRWLQPDRRADPATSGDGRARARCDADGARHDHPRRSEPLRQATADTLQRRGRHPALPVRASRLHRDRNPHRRRRSADRRSRSREPDRGRAAGQPVRLHGRCARTRPASSIPILRTATSSAGSRRTRSRCWRPRSAAAASSARSRK